MSFQSDHFEGIPLRPTPSQMTLGEAAATLDRYPVAPGMTIMCGFKRGAPPAPTQLGADGDLTLIGWSSDRRPYVLRWLPALECWAAAGFRAESHPLPEVQIIRAENAGFIVGWAPWG